MQEDNPINFLLAVMDHVEQMKEGASESMQATNLQAGEGQRALASITDAAHQVQIAVDHLTKIHSAYVEEMNCRRLHRGHLWVLLPMTTVLGFCAGIVVAVA